MRPPNRRHILKKALRPLMVGGIAAITTIYSSDSPAPPPPDPNCRPGIPAYLALQFAMTFQGSINSQMAAPSVKAFDSAGNPLANIPITFTAPATGPSASFATFAGYDAVPLPDPLQATLNTGAACYGTSPLTIANGQIGSYQIMATAPSAPPLFIPMANTAPETAAFISSPETGFRFLTHIGSLFRPVHARVQGQSGLGVAGLPVTFNAPAAGPGATFADGSTSAIAYTNALGYATSPALRANDQAGTFSVFATGGDVGHVALGPFTNGGATTTTMELLDDDQSIVTFGTPINLKVSVAFPGLPTPMPPGGPANPFPDGMIVVRADGVTVATADLGGDFFYVFLCQSCVIPTFVTVVKAADIPFGTHTLVASYEGATTHSPSASSALVETVLPAVTAPTATQLGASLAGVTGGTIQWKCTLASGAWESIAPAQAQSVPYSFPYGVFRYRIDNCSYLGPMFGVPPPGFWPVQYLVLQFSAPLPPGTAFVNYGPTRANSSPHWYEIASQIDGTTIRIALSDSGPGDDDMTVNYVIAGLGGPATPLPPIAATDVIEYYDAALDHYFVTALTLEVSALDNQMFPGWLRTGLGFKAYPVALAGASPVCRFYMPPGFGDSHFYSASPLECAQTQQRFPSLVLESSNVFYVGLPDAMTGSCAVGTVPVYRVWNGRTDSNHRYTTSRNLRDQMVAHGYVAEGYGPDLVIMCAAQ